MSLAETNWSEKRDFIRMKLNSEVALVFGNPVRKLTGHCRNLSGAGMSIELDEALPSGTKFTATFANIDSSRLDEPDLKTIAEVARVEKTAADRFLHGCSMLEILA